jgi:putative ABC transport system ATP-binding protein
MDLLGEINRSGITILVVTHEAEVAARAHRTIRLRDGKIVTHVERGAA